MAILMVATINDLRREGVDLRSAVIEGSAIRLRPILMTTATTVFGALPICIAGGAADQLNKPLAITIVAGLLASAAFKLIGIPVVYELVGRTRWSTVPQSKSFRDGERE
jgi:multidrug efflux pump subunit AcrB